MTAPKFDIAAAAEWARQLCYAMLGPVVGEWYYRMLPAKTVLLAYARVHGGEQEPSA